MPFGHFPTFLVAGLPGNFQPCHPPAGTAIGNGSISTGNISLVVLFGLDTTVGAMPFSPPPSGKKLEDNIWKYKYTGLRKRGESYDTAGRSDSGSRGYTCRVNNRYALYNKKMKCFTARKARDTFHRFPFGSGMDKQQNPARCD